MKRSILTLILGVVLGLFSCEKPDKSSLPFVKIYDDQNGNRSFSPLSMTKATVDNGYFVLSAYDGWRIHLMKMDKDGNFEWNLELPEQYVNAVPSLLNINQQLYLVCMDPLELDARILRIDENSRQVIQISHLEEVSYPLHAYYNGTDLYLMSCPLSSQMTVIHQVSQALDTVVRVGALSISANVDDLLLKHVMHTGKQYPFFIQSTPEKDYFAVNAFYNYSFSTVFFDSDLQFSGVYNGAAMDGGISSLHPLGSNTFALARTSGENVFMNPKAVLNPSAIAMATSIEAQGDAELNHTLPTIIRQMTILGKNYLAFLASSRSNQLVLKLYDESGKKVKSTYLSKNVPIEACDMVFTPYGELLMLAKVRIMGSYNRIGSIKLSRSSLVKLVEGE
ncbi:MAG: hypothetical protein FJZ80_08105 [Bacteroidetes bacterium]|nr:hypothetical protein [Bacteroidota bacterium]MBM3424605.1 hypothetical protein [Bacteroidota bacterium]